MIIERTDRANIYLHKILSKMQAKLHISPSRIALLDWDIIDVNGKCRLKHTGKSHSFVRNFFNVCCCNGTHAMPTAATLGAGYLAAKILAGTAVYSVTYGIGFNSILNSVDYGIVVGTDDTAESFEDYKLIARCASGIGSGQLVHSTQLADCVWDSGTTSFINTINRQFTNNSGASITIKEVGVYAFLQYAASSNNAICCVIRDVLPTPIVLANGESTPITYKLTYTFP